MPGLPCSFLLPEGSYGETPLAGIASGNSTRGGGTWLILRNSIMIIRMGFVTIAWGILMGGKAILDYK